MFKFHRPTFRQATEEYIDYAIFQFISEANLKAKQTLFKHLKLCKFDWNTITQKDVGSFQKYLLSKYSRSYSAKMITHLKAFLRICIKKEYISHQEFNRLDFMSPPKQKRKNRIIPKEDMLKMLKYCKDKGDIDFYFYILTLYITGSRPNEIIKLTYKDLNFKDNTITIYMNKVKDEKIITVDKELLNSLMQILKSNGLTNGCIFIGSIQHKDFYGKKLKRLREELDLPEYYILYLLRHTSATNVLEGTGNIYLAQKLLGHDNIKTTSQYYIASNPKQTQKATEYLWNNLKS